MTHRVARISLAVTLVFTLIIPPPPASACGPFFRLAAYTDSRSPDLPYSDFMKGRLGLVQPSYWDIFLFAAYRNLSGAPFSASELAALEKATGTNPALPSASDQAATTNQKTEETLWQEALATTSPPRHGVSFSDAKGVIRAEMHDSNYLWFYNCLPDAFRIARETLAKRRAQFGADSAAVQSWLDAQQAVFENCSGSSSYGQPPKEAVIPGPAAPGPRTALSYPTLLVRRARGSPRETVYLTGTRRAAWVQ
jgi:hypothetical protein